MAADFQSRSTPGGRLTIAPPELSLITAVIPSLRRRLSSVVSFRKSIASRDLEGVYTASKVAGVCAYASEPALVRDGDKEGRFEAMGHDQSRPSSSSSYNPVTPDAWATDDSRAVTPKHENDSGVAWNRLSPGYNLLRSAGYEAQQSRPDNQLARSLFINGLLYFIEALPTDLSAGEISAIQAKLPKEIEVTRPPCPHTTREQMEGPIPPQRMERSLLHRFLASSIVRIFIVVHFLIPYVKLFLQYLYEYDRTHHITERILVISVDAIDNLGKGGTRIGSAASRFGDGRVGSTIQDLATWGLEEAVRGISEGVGEGLAIMGVVEPHARSDLI